MARERRKLHPKGKRERTSSPLPLLQWPSHTTTTTTRTSFPPFCLFCIGNLPIAFYNNVDKMLIRSFFSSFLPFSSFLFNCVIYIWAAVCARACVCERAFGSEVSGPMSIICKYHLTLTELTSIDIMVLLCMSNRCHSKAVTNKRQEDGRSSGHFPLFFFSCSYSPPLKTTASATTTILFYFFFSSLFPSSFTHSSS